VVRNVPRRGFRLRVAQGLFPTGAHGYRSGPSLAIRIAARSIDAMYPVRTGPRCPQAHSWAHRLTGSQAHRLTAGLTAGLTGPQAHSWAHSWAHRPTGSQLGSQLGSQAHRLTAGLGLGCGNGRARRQLARNFGNARDALPRVHAHAAPQGRVSTCA
jgi:hypothetical protein